MTESVQLPTSRFASSSYRLVHVTNQNRLRSGKGLSGQYAPQYWRAAVTTELLDRTAQGEWQAFFDKVEGGLYPILLHDPARQFPIGYENFDGLNVAGGGTFDGSGQLKTITDLQNIVVEQLPALFSLAAGDYLSVDTGIRKSLHRVQVATLGSAGGEVSIEVRPAISLQVSVGNSVRFHKAAGEFVVEPESVKGLESGIYESRLTFSATSRVS